MAKEEVKKNIVEKLYEKKSIDEEKREQLLKNLSNINL